jgi:AcrR family transcriptional regulator
MHAITQAHTPPRHRTKRAEILAHATDVLNESGVSGFTMAAVAERMSLHPASLAHYFKKKDELAVTCMLDTVDRLATALDGAAPQSSPAERVSFFVRRVFGLYRRVAAGEEPHLVALNETRMIDEPFRTQLMTAFGRLHRRVAMLLEGGSPALDADAGRARSRLILRHLMWAPVWLEYYDQHEYPRACERFLDILLNGLASDPDAFHAPLLPVWHAPQAPRGASRERFLDAATELINELGHKGASVEAMSQRLNVSKGSFYHHNRDKSELVIACFERSLALLSGAQRVAARAGGTGWTQLVAAAIPLISGHASGTRQLLRTYALSALPLVLRQGVIVKLERIAHCFAGMISDGIADGSIRAVDPMIAAEIVMTTINTSSGLQIWLPSDADVFSLYVKPAFVGLSGFPLPRGVQAFGCEQAAR